MPTAAHPRAQTDPPGAATVVRLGAVSYLNTLPLIEGLDKLAGVELTLAPPSRLTGLLADGSLDAALAPVIDAQRSAQPLALLDCGMIGCEGPTMTVRLYSAVPFDRIRRVGADVESHTSVALLRVLLRRRHGLTPDLARFDAGAGGAPPDDLDALLMIGDKVVVSPPPIARFPHQLDLGEAWTEDTGLPFVYALWMCPAARAGAPAIRAAGSVLDRQRRHNATRLDWIAACRAPEHKWPVDLAQDYLGRMLRYTVGPRERQAVDAFFDAAAACGVIATRRPTVWADAG